ncbi:paraquat-inducible protein A [Planctobacterium marinum]|uniref:paraquat-inducible protein A n=1 Tax=Planctobacterium marinum TaxID=1631968 RepID=UPI001E52A516|nr:paraquat-inducible protein A [Planctobacterium marinum]MCC2604908.1 paraquat-inducible protein A [Planctobacterium marinum]
MLRQNLGFALNLIALGLFVPGILLPMFSLDMELLANLGNSALTASLVDKQLSILGTVDELWQDQRFLVGFLILFFSVIIPVLKTFLVAIARFCRTPGTQQKLSALVSNIGKWSMADVFVVAIFLAVLSTDHSSTSSQQEINMGLFKVSFELSSQTLSNVGPGFWYFTGYCIVALAGTLIFQHGVRSQSR